MARLTGVALLAALAVPPAMAAPRAVGAASPAMAAPPRVPAQAPQLPRAAEIRRLDRAAPGLRGRVTVFHWPGGEERARRALGVLERAPDLPGLEPGLPSGVELYLAPDRPVWDALTGGTIPEWGAGVAIPSLRRIAIPLFDTPAGGPSGRDRTVLHEWAHLGLHQALPDLRIPRWFDEGYAQWASGGWNRVEGWKLRFALASGRAPPLDSLTLDWPAGASEAGLAYLLAASAFEYLFEAGGETGVRIFVARWRETGDFEAAFQATFALTTGGFERLWAAHVRNRYGWVLVAQQTAAFWLLAGAGILVLVWFRRRRNAERMARLRAGEGPDDPAWWDGAPVDPPSPG